nr:DUF1178 family protein [Sphingomonas jinjuensis]
MRCGGGHVFEAWFASSVAYDDQRDAGQLACPLCGDESIGKAAMAPAIPAKSNRAPPPATVKAALKALACEQAKALEGSEWVGGRFADRARAMHQGDEPNARIHGQASLAEAKALIDEGVPVAPLPLPIIPPEQAN